MTAPLTSPGVFRKRPIDVEAIRFTGKNGSEVKEWVNSRADFNRTTLAAPVDGRYTWFVTKGMSVSTANQAWNYVKDGQNWGQEIVAAVYDYLHDTWVGVKKGDWILRGTQGEFYPHDGALFAENYQQVL